MPRIDLSTFQFSKSSLNSLLGCPHAFELRYIRKVDQKVGFAMERGTKAHQYLTRIHRGVYREGEAIGQYATYVENFRKIVQKYKLGAPLYFDLKLTGKFDDLLFKGEIDVVYGMKFGPEYRYMVLDYKTAKTAENLDKYRLELQVYSNFFSQIGARDVRRYGIMFLSDGGFLSEENDEKYELLHEKVALAKKIVKSDEYPAIRTKECSNCPVNHSCETYMASLFERKRKKKAKLDDYLRSEAAKG